MARHFCMTNGYAGCSFDCETVEEAIGIALDNSRKMSCKCWLSECLADEPTYCYTSITGKECKAYTAKDFVEIGETSRKYYDGCFCGWEFLHHPYSSAL